MWHERTAGGWGPLRGSGGHRWSALPKARVWPEGHPLQRGWLLEADTALSGEGVPLGWRSQQTWGRWGLQADSAVVGPKLGKDLRVDMERSWVAQGTRVTEECKVGVVGAWKAGLSRQPGKGSGTAIQLEVPQ